MSTQGRTPVRKSSTGKSIATAVLIAALGALAGKAIDWGWNHYYKPFALEVDTYYQAVGGQKSPAKEAVIDLGVPAVQPQTANDRGKAYWHDLEPHPTKKTSISVDYAGYHLVKGPDVPLRPRWGAIEVLLEANAPTLAIGHGVSTSPAIPPVVATVTEVPAQYRSGPKPSGPGKAFGEWFTQCSGDLPKPGLVIKSEHFELVGDRQCGAWSECKQTVKTPTKVCYKFHMQGHDEWLGPFQGLIPTGKNGQALSEGVLSVVWASGNQ